MGWVNLSVFDSNGKSHSRTSVPLVQEGEAKPEHGYFCEVDALSGRTRREARLTRKRNQEKISAFVRYERARTNPDGKRPPDSVGLPGADRSNRRPRICEQISLSRC
jgi:hypothetical protein